MAGTWLAFRSGGFFVGTTAIATLLFGALFLLWFMVAARPFAALSAPLGIAAGALALFSLWALASQIWSHAPARALVTFDLVLLYLFAVAFFGLAASSAAARANVARSVALVFTVVSIAGLISRVLPELWPITSALHIDRLSYPVSYWNAQGAIASLAVIACLHLASSTREPRMIRALAAGALPLVACALLFTLSRGAIALLPVGLVTYLALARPRGGVSALVVTLPATAIAVAGAYRAGALINEAAPTAESIAQGRTVAWIAGACALAAAVAMLTVGRSVDARTASMRGPTRRQWRAAVAALLVAVVVVGAAFHVPRRISELVTGLDRVHLVSDDGDARNRLTSLGDNGRADQWRVALDAFAREPLIGSGAGTYVLLWRRDRHIDQDVTNAHSLYLEALAELGLFGGLLIVLSVGALLAGSLRRARDQDRGFGALAFAAGLVWAVHAGIDWDWQLPALTLPVLALMASASGDASSAPDGPPWPERVPRLVVGLALLALLVTPLNIARSQRLLDAAARDVRAGRCDAAIKSALASNRVLAARPEPFQILALCDARLGRPDLAHDAAQAALDRDPGNWQFIYGLAVMRALDGLDPRPLLREAQRSDPRSELIADGLRRFGRASSPEQWRRLAVRTPMPF